MKGHSSGIQHIPDQLFYVPEATNVAQEIQLEKTEHEHISKALRKVIHDVIYVTNGKGSLFKAEIINTHKKTTSISILSEEDTSGFIQPSLSLAVASTKNIKRYEWMIEKCTEIGVRAFSPFYSRYSERNTLRTDRMESICISAMKQSLKLYKPEIQEILSLSNLLGKYSTDDTIHKYIAHKDESNSMLWDEKIHQTQPSVVLIGPEGGFTDEEIALAKKHGFSSVQLGYNRLRTETAAICACTLLNAKYDE